MNETKLYIAYGSNLNISQMKERCPNASIVACTTLKGWRLHIKGARDGCAFATIDKEDGWYVPVVIWKISKSDERSLDRYEGYPYSYRKETIDISINEVTHQAMVYIMNADHLDHKYPSVRYLNCISEGYDSFHFDKNILSKAVYGLERSKYIMMTPEIKKQILAVRDSGEVNMFDVRGVQIIANREGYYDLVCYLMDNQDEYGRFILTGEAPGLED